LWQAAQAKTVEVVSSDLVLLEALVGPLKSGNTALVQTYEQALLRTDLRLLPITHAVLREPAQLRATTRLKTPDALHAATARQAGCVLFLTDDVGFRGVPGLPLSILDEVLAS
jgi:predicted nucleic acid-binding protein